MANTLFKRASAYCKKHPRTSFQDAIKILSGKKKKAAKKVGTVKKKAAPKKTVVKKAKTVIIAGTKKRKKTIKTPFGNFSIGSVALSKIAAEQTALARYNRELVAAQQRLKGKGLTASYKNGVRREIDGIRKLIQTAKKNISALKRSI